ncbi:MAG: hypothetical protein ACIARR_08195 [Phycisphaerales bacterium JB059]
MPPTPTIEQWTQALRAAAARAFADDPLPIDGTTEQRLAYARSFRDESGARPEVVSPLLADLLQTPIPPDDSRSIDVRFWSCLNAGPRAPLPPLRASGPLLHDPADQTAIEVRTESELIALHALHELAERRGEESLRERVRDAARWHLRELQPDNATNRPWAIQVFARLSLVDDARIAGAALVHAQTQLHGCQLTLGRPDRLSACILLHAARSLESDA